MTRPNVDERVVVDYSCPYCGHDGTDEEAAVVTSEGGADRRGTWHRIVLTAICEECEAEVEVVDEDVDIDPDWYGRY